MVKALGHLMRPLKLPVLLGVVSVSVLMFNYYNQLKQVHCRCMDSSMNMNEVTLEEAETRSAGDTVAAAGDVNAINTATDVRAIASARKLTLRRRKTKTVVRKGGREERRSTPGPHAAPVDRACAELFVKIAHRGIPKRFKEEVIVQDMQNVGRCAWTQNITATTIFQELHRNVTGGAGEVMVTQWNSPIGTNITYDASKKTIAVDENLHGMLIKDFPEQKKRYPRCAVVGNGGILSNSSCGAQIDQMDFVIRCNLAPVHGKFSVDVGSRTDVITANPTIIVNKFQSLNYRRKPFVEGMSTYGGSIILVSGFSFAALTPIAMRLAYTLEDFNARPRVGFFNPEYMRAIARFWKGQGVNEPRPSSGLMMTSVAMDLCDQVHVYGFWPFDRAVPSDGGPGGTSNGGPPRELTHHYYDDQKPNRRHSMPREFLELLALHSRGVLSLHVGEC